MITRVDRVAGERRVPQGSIGRVMKIDGETIEVAVVGLGILTYARDEVSPRRVGQALFRAPASRCLGGAPPLVVLETTGTSSSACSDA